MSEAEYLGKSHSSEMGTPTILLGLDATFEEDGGSGVVRAHDGSTGGWEASRVDFNVAYNMFDTGSRL